MNDQVNRVTDLEMQMAFLQDALDKLSDEYYAQQKTIDSLLLKINQLQERIQVLGDSKEELMIADERPPHY